MKLEVRRADFSRDADSIRDVRTKVFVLEQEVTPEEEWDGLDEAAIHVLAFADGKENAVGTARMLETETGGAKIGRMAVLKGFRNIGVGGKMLEALVAMARARKMKYVELGAQVQAIGFYEKYGFRAEGQVFLDARIEHRKMVLKL
jgi:ElaA protein